MTSLIRYNGMYFYFSTYNEYLPCMWQDKVIKYVHLCFDIYDKRGYIRFQLVIVDHMCSVWIYILCEHGYATYVHISLVLSMG